MALIKIQNLTKDFVNGDIVTSVLKGVSFEINQGEFVAIMGPSGSGKSTLMHILGFLDRATEGLYEFEGEDVTTFDDDRLAEIRNQRVGFVFQAFNLLPRTSVIDNVRLPLIYGTKKNQLELAQQALHSVGLGDRMDYMSNQISGGQKQRVAIARALVNDPAVIFADEPTGNLDSKSGNTVMKILQDMNAAGRTIILVTHEQETAEHATRIIRVRDGVIEYDEPVSNRVFANDSGELTK